jgi:hypothetical protein
MGQFGGQLGAILIYVYDLLIHCPQHFVQQSTRPDQTRHDALTCSLDNGCCCVDPAAGDDRESSRDGAGVQDALCCLGVAPVGPQEAGGDEGQRGGGNGCGLAGAIVACIVTTCTWDPEHCAYILVSLTKYCS